MTAAALSQKAQPYEVPEGGLGSFLTATVGDWSDEALNSDNYYDIVKPTADQLATFGREEDDRIAHVATGETVIPMAVFEEDPALKEVLFSRMRDMGIDPERYIVGNQLNSINPVTGQPEFFLKKIFKGIKKAVKGVVKVFKKIAPIVLSIGLAMTPLGPIAGAALGSGLGTLIQGGDLKDAFKSALIGGAMGGLSSGIGSVMKGGEFMAGVKSGLPSGLGGGVNPTLPSVEELASKVTEATPVVDKTVANQALASATPSTPLTATDAIQSAGGTPTNLNMTPPVSGGPTNLNMSGPTNLNMSGYQGTPLANDAVSSALGIKPVALDAVQQAGGIPTNLNMSGYQGTPLADDAVSSALGLKPAAAQKTVVGASPATGGGTAPPLVDSAGQITVAGENAITSSIDTDGFFKSMGDFIRNPTDLSSLKQAFIPDRLTASDITKFIREHPQGSANFTATAGQNVLEALAESGINPGIMRTYMPMLVAGGLAAQQFDFFKVPEMENISAPFGGNTGIGLLQQYPEKYDLPQPGQYYQAPGAAKGGNIDHFPRKNGPINGPGTGTSDDIPAMLSDGEFVMTAKAVRGAGNGSRQAGMNRMYDMMRKFEGGAARGN
jgi:hypothetical protein